MSYYQVSQQAPFAFQHNVSASRPQLVEKFSTQSGLPKSEELVLDPWPDRFHVRHDNRHWTRGGLDAYLVAAVGIILWSATGFLYYAKQHTLIVPMERLQGPIVNINSINFLLSLAGSIAASAWRSALAILGARWLLLALQSGGIVNIGRWR